MSSSVEENGECVNEPIKNRRSQRNKQTAKGKEMEESAKNGIDCHEENHSADVTENNDIENETEEINEEKGEMENGDSTSTNTEYIDVCGNGSEVQNSNHEENGIAQEEEEVVEQTKEEIEVELTEQDTNETEDSAKNDESVIVEPETNGISTDEFGETSQNGLNGSDSGSNYEDAHATQKTELSPEKEDGAFSNKISSFPGMWNLAEDSPKIGNVDETLLNHPYLSKVSGRRGIKERLNSSMSSFEKKDETPKNTLNLDDSFRVRTNPTRLNSAEMEPTLRKFKGKRCLNANDPEDDLYNSKRRKLDEKEPGLFGSILWTPFKKKTSEEPIPKVVATESKLSRLLNPFRFWKKMEGQNGK